MQLPFFKRNLESSEHHLDVGVGTGYYPIHTLPTTKLKSITLMDINQNTLDTASVAIKAAGYRGEVDAVIHNIFQTFPEDSALRAKFDSVSMFFVFHCLSGKFPSKAESVARNLAEGLTENGVFYGSTILGRVPGQGSRKIEHNWFGSLLMWFYNRIGVFDNVNDEADELKKGLEAVFKEVEVEVIGMCGLFICRKPIAKN